jgi:hypothetical protein
MDPKKISAVKDMDPTNINTVTKIRSTRRLDTFTLHGKSSNEGLTAATECVADLFLRLKTDSCCGQQRTVSQQRSQGAPPTLPRPWRLMSELSWEVAHGFRVYTSDSPFEHRRRRRRMLDWMVEMGAEKEAIKAATQRKKLAKEQAEKWPAAQVEAAKVGVSMAGWRALMVLIVAISMGMSMTVVASSVLSSSPPMHASTASSTASSSETMCATDASNPY